MPFLVDSVTAELSRQERAVHLVVHPQLVVRRDATGVLQEILDVDATPARASSARHVESWMHVEIDRESPTRPAEAIAAALRRVLSRRARHGRGLAEDARRVRRARRRARRRAARRRRRRGGRQTRRGLLSWLADDHFTFLGYREYALEREDGEDVLRAGARHRPGLLRYDQPRPGSFGRLTAEARAKAREPARC